MASNALKQTPLQTDAERVLAALDAAREATIALVADLDDDALTGVHSPIMSPLVWDLGHIAAYEDLWLAHRHGAVELLRPELAELYDAFETPRAIRGEIETLDTDEALAYMRDVRARVAAIIADRGVGDGVVCEMVIRHELQHSETMRQTLAIAGLLPPGEPRLAPIQGSAEWIEIPAGAFAMGAGDEHFAYDNERPRHSVEVPAFAIGRSPVSNAEWMDFSAGGAYARETWWSPAGWAWRQEHDITHDPAIEAGDPRAPVCHVSWFEADAFARAHGARLPSEAEWEKAATWTETPGDEPRSATVGAGVLDAVGQVWEWTHSRFRGYPGFVAYPYREYSEVFFGDDYRVLRGNSWATAPRVASRRFRNWDLPQRRQIFAGLRLARDAR
jgi:iron(II)-dependent oxidoreductase